MKKKDKSLIETSLVRLGIGIIIGGAIYPSVDNGTIYTLLPGMILIYLSIFFSH